MKKGTCSPLEGAVDGIMNMLETVVSKMDAAMCLDLHRKPDMTPAMQKVPVSKPQHMMTQKPGL